MIVIYYDGEETEPELLQYIVDSMTKKMNEDVIALPKSYDVLFNTSFDQLLSIRNLIDKTLDEKRKHS